MLYVDTPRARANVENAKKDAFGKGKNKCRLAEVGLNIRAAWGAGEPEARVGAGQGGYDFWITTQFYDLNIIMSFPGGIVTELAH